MLGEHLHDPPLGRQVVVGGEGLTLPLTVGDLEDVLQPVGAGLVGAEDAESLRVVAGHVAEVGAKHLGGLREGRPGAGHLHRVVAEVGQHQVLEEQPAVGMRVGAHPPVALGGEALQLGDQGPVLVEELVGVVALEPRLKHGEMVGVGLHLGQRHLVRSPGPLGGQPVDELRPGPPLGALEDDHRPCGPGGVAGLARVLLDGGDLGDHRVERLRHQLVHLRRVVARDPVHLVPVALEQRGELLLGDARQHRGVGDLVPVEVKDRQHRPVGHGVQKLVGMPPGGERAGLRLTVADDAGDEQVGVVESGAIGVGERVTEFAALVDGTGGLRRHVGRDAARERELAEERAHPVLVLGDVRVDLAVGALEIGVGHRGGAAVPGPDHVDGVEVPVADHAVHVRVDEVEPRGRPPVAEQTGFDVLRTQPLPEQRVVEQVDLTDREIVRRPPVGVDEGEIVVGEGACGSHVGGRLGHRAPPMGGSPPVWLAVGRIWRSRPAVGGCVSALHGVAARAPHTSNFGPSAHTLPFHGPYCHPVDRA